MKVTCDFCGASYEGNLERCPSCGASNGTRQETIKQPQTIEQLKDWYKARNLPPEETTRFFIGKDIKEKRAFGIYKDESTGEFVVYKNKDTGERAIRYHGYDEAYAVNELYQRLKAEIANQKNLNANRRANVSTYSYSSCPHNSKSVDRASKAFIGIVAFFIVFNMLMMIIGIICDFSEEKTSIHGDYYYAYDDELSYYDSSHKWWVYDEDEQDWSMLDTSIESYTFYNSDYYDDTDEEDTDKLYAKYSVCDLEPYLSFMTQDNKYDDYFKVTNDYDYLTKHPTYARPGSSGYYVYEDNIYYYLDDWHYNSGYCSGESQTGWYVYSDDTDDWSYYCDYSDYDSLGDLYYNSDNYDYRSTEEDSDIDKIYTYSNQDIWYEVPSFSSSDYYETYETHNSEYTTHAEEVQKELEEQQSSSSGWDWSSDSSSDWSSSDSWDSGGTDWGSDW